MAISPPIGNRITATIKSIQGHCSAGHQAGEHFPISCHDSGGLCGFCYHNIFSNLQTLQFGGTMPWWQDSVVTLACPDPHNRLVLELKIFLF